MPLVARLASALAERAEDPWTRSLKTCCVREGDRGFESVFLQRRVINEPQSAPRNSVVNPLLDVQRYLPPLVYVASYGQFDDQPEIDLYDRMLRETDFSKQRALMRELVGRDSHRPPDSNFTMDRQCPASDRIVWGWMRSDKLTQPLGFLGHETYQRPRGAVDIG